MRNLGILILASSLLSSCVTAPRQAKTDSLDVPSGERSLAAVSNSSDAFSRSVTLQVPNHYDHLNCSISSGEGKLDCGHSWDNPLDRKNKQPIDGNQFLNPRVQAMLQGAGQLKGVFSDGRFILCVVPVSGAVRCEDISADDPAISSVPDEIGSPKSLFIARDHALDADAYSYYGLARRIFASLSETQVVSWGVGEKKVANFNFGPSVGDFFYLDGPGICRQFKTPSGKRVTSLPTLLCWNGLKIDGAVNRGSSETSSIISV